MNFNIQLLESSNINFITLKQVKQYLRVDDDLDNELIEEMIKVALTHAEIYIGRNLKESTWQLSVYDQLPSRINLMYGPVSKLLKFKLYKPNGEMIYLTDYHYILNQFAEFIDMRVDISMQKCEIIYNTGYDLLTLPSPIKQGMLEHIAKLYDLRGSEKGLPLSAKSLYQAYRKVRF